MYGREDIDKNMDVGAVLDGFAEAMFRLLFARYQQHLSELGLTMVQAQVLRLLHQHKSLSTGQVATELGISAPAVTQLTDRLIRKHLIERRSAPGDRRSVLIGLSLRGKRAMEHFRDRRGEIFQPAMERLSIPERQMALEVMEKMTAAMNVADKTALSTKEASKPIDNKRAAADRGK